MKDRRVTPRTQLSTRRAQLHRLVRRALDEGLISMGRAAELLRISREDMRKLGRQWHG